MKNLIKIALVFATTCLTGFSAWAATAEPGTYKIDVAHSNVGFDVSHKGISLVVGRFNRFSGEVVFNPDGQSSVNVEILTASVDTNQKARDNHLKKADFFNANSFPKMKFVSNQVEYDEDGNPVKMTGQFTLLDVTKEISLNIQALGAGKGRRGENAAGFEATGQIKRSDFGLGAGSAPTEIGDEVGLRLNVELLEKL